MANNNVQLKSELPSNRLAEENVLTLLITENKTIPIALEELTPEVFYFEENQIIYTGIITLYQKNTVVDIVKLTSYLQDHHLLEKIGGLKTLNVLVNNKLKKSCIEDYIELILEKFLRRKLIELGNDIASSSSITNMPIEDLLELFEKNFFNLRNQIQQSRDKKLFTIEELLIRMFSKLRKKFPKKNYNFDSPYGLESGFKDLDSLIYGFQRSELIIIGARPSVGKTAFALNILTSIAKTYKLPVLFMSLEMSKEQLMYRLLSTEAEVSSMKIKTNNMTKEELNKVDEAKKTLSSLDIFIDDRSNISAQAIRMQLKKILLEKQKMGIVIVDYLQLMEDSNYKNGNRIFELSIITKSLKSIAKEFNVPVIAISQLSRNIETRVNKRPLLSDLRDSGSIEQDSDLVLMLFRENYYNSKKQHEDLTEIIIAKNRNGSTGTIFTKFNSEFTKFSNN